MSAGQVLFVVSLGLIALLMLRRFLLVRSVPQYSAADVAGRVGSTGTTLLLDVRTAQERERRSIKGSMHIPVHELRRRMGELEKHRAKEVICYCASGNRSLSAAGMLRRAGFNAANMRGGITQWNS